MSDTITTLDAGLNKGLGVRPGNIGVVIGAGSGSRSSGDGFFIELEDGSGVIELEDGSGNILLEIAP